MEYKFRGKRVDNGEWIYGSLINTPTAINGFKATIIDEKANLWYTLSNGNLHINKESWNIVIPETIGQYTGLKDKNGKEIYEGDIVRVNKLTFESTGKLPENLVVKYFNGMFQLFRDIKCLMGLHLAYIEDGEIIGNLWDNPELLEV